MATNSATQKFGLGQAIVLGGGLVVFVALLFAEPAALHNPAEQQQAGAVAPDVSQVPDQRTAQTGAMLDLPNVELNDGLESELKSLENQLAAARSKADSASVYRAIAKVYGQRASAHAAQAMERAAMVSGSPEDAIAAANGYRDAIADWESNPELTKGLNAKAIQWYTEYLRLKPGDKTAELELALRQVESEAPMQGILKLRKIAEDDPANYKAQLYLGLFSLRTNQVDKAIERFRQAIQADPAQAEPYFYLGRALASQPGKQAEARQLLEKARTLARESALREQIDALLRNL